MGHVVLLDMDGTITPPREKVGLEVCESLIKLANYAKIGIVSGSGFDFIYEQCGKEFGESGLSERIDILPCNGTQVYKYFGDAWEVVYQVSMKDEIGIRFYNEIVSTILSIQSEFIKTINTVDSKIPISGSFLNYRTSMLNWSIIGRDVSKSERENFVTFNEDDTLRNLLADSLKKNLSKELSSKLMMALGGQTSIDITPVGWDKRYALKHYPEDIAWFVGDKCMPGQNDYFIYEHLRSEGRSFETIGPDNTIEIIENIIEKIS